ncbi:hypothetical protein [Salimicrobium flavidum]|uniref:Uncharacterized protein n=1 Tax=Salimicrobium flavidum TaxID=570947 RepID=A0A1N7IZH6_9BACI|nr:hypothetical protein [Salimicrobium flavidum]SIS42532.1 hypothetical protein SAMN05421687_10359 [Salimicrobium flavidum]
MLELLLSHIPSTLFHILTGVLITDLIFHGPSFTYRKTRFTLLGSVAFLVVLPDIPKLFGFLIGHSLITVPILALLFAFIMRKLLSMRVPAIWWRLTLVLVISSLGIDFLGNGVHLLYPVNEKTYALSVIRYEFIYLLPIGLLLFFRLR